MFYICGRSVTKSLNILKDWANACSFQSLEYRLVGKSTKCIRNIQPGDAQIFPPFPCRLEPFLQGKVVLEYSIMGCKAFLTVGKHRIPLAPIAQPGSYSLCKDLINGGGQSEQSPVVGQRKVPGLRQQNGSGYLP
ncbi:hypothetical protein HNY73_007422 [Argiope bruennichi]|uniref:Uncharacterized protein n=1 Tax=Argiope bruennichi TaxID=94029 RepID=A0A8T0FIX6_ARGBR|nr:hypothetical protein HNY73_007422 [Argiope bruennichi]